MRFSEEWLQERQKKAGAQSIGKAKQSKSSAIKRKSRPVSPAQAAKARHHQISSEGIHTIRVKPMSVNAAWKGQRFKTDEYEIFEQYCACILPASIEIPDGRLEIFLEWGLSSSLADYDNPIKPFQDILQKRFGFDDRRIYDAHISKRDVEPGQEYIRFIIIKARMQSIFDLLAGGAD